MVSISAAPVVIDPLLVTVIFDTADAARKLLVIEPLLLMLLALMNKEFEDSEDAASTIRFWAVTNTFPVVEIEELVKETVALLACRVSELVKL